MSSGINFVASSVCRLGCKISLQFNTSFTPKMYELSSTLTMQPTRVRSCLDLIDHMGPGRFILYRFPTARSVHRDSFRCGVDDFQKIQLAGSAVVGAGLSAGRPHGPSLCTISRLIKRRYQQVRLYDLFFKNQINHIKRKFYQSLVVSIRATNSLATRPGEDNFSFMSLSALLCAQSSAELG